MLDLAVNRGLNVQTELPDGKRRKNEALIHSIFFPMRKDSEEVSDHDVWLLSEEYHYYDYIASDMPLNQIKWDNGQNLFDADVDEAVGELLTRIGDENGSCRLDLALSVSASTMLSAVILDKPDHFLNGRTSSSWAKYADTLRRISLA